MNEILHDLTGILMAIVGVALLYTLVSNKNNTVGVIQASSSGFAQDLATAMGMNMASQSFSPISPIVGG